MCSCVYVCLYIDMYIFMYIYEFRYIVNKLNKIYNIHIQIRYMIARYYMKESETGVLCYTLKTH